MLAGGSRSTRSISFPAAIFTAPVSSVATGLDLDPEGLLRAIELRDLTLLPTMPLSMSLLLNNNLLLV